MSETCHECGGPVVQERGPQSVQVGERFVTVEAEYIRCTACGEIVFHLREAEAMERAAVDLVRREEGLLSPGEIEAIRAKYGLSQAAFEQLIHAGPKTVTRWERGSVAPNGTADTLLRILRDRPDVVDQLARERGVLVRIDPAARTPAREKRRAAGGM
ncbi:MAG TPA: type II TA system antitoxin MqsA family protein [Longimicrobium sp.]|nr:type II TA system antitoxin MqsA family protein [Longimicrobium sp.]